MRTPDASVGEAEVTATAFVKAVVELGRDLETVPFESSEQFADTATARLADFTPPEGRPLEAVAEWALTTATLPQQLDPDGRFGDPPITLFRSEHFFVAVLVWLDGLVNIHEHNFAGAFRVLEGGSLHASYRYDERSQIADGVTTGALTADVAEQLRPGDSRPIYSRRQGIHCLFHHVAPSLSLVVRTYIETPGEGQGAFLRAGFGHEGVLSPSVSRQHRLVALHNRVPALQLRDAVLRAIDDLPPAAAFAVALEFFRRASVDDGARAADRLAARLGVPEQATHQVAREQKTDTTVGGLRNLARDETARFGWALLRASPGRDETLAFLARGNEGSHEGEGTSEDRLASVIGALVDDLPSGIRQQLGVSEPDAATSLARGDLAGLSTTGQMVFSPLAARRG